MENQYELIRCKKCDSSDIDSSFQCYDCGAFCISCDSDYSRHDDEPKPIVDMIRKVSRWDNSLWLDPYSDMWNFSKI